MTDMNVDNRMAEEIKGNNFCPSKSWLIANPYMLEVKEDNKMGGTILVYDKSLVITHS